MPRIFISYRRTDSQTISGRVHDRLEKVFGDKNVFKDVDDIPAGKDFRRVLQDAANDSDVMLVMIGKQWLNVTDDSGNRRLDDPDDFVRIEVETALRSNHTLVIPVLVQDARMPNSRELPESLRDLAFKNAVIVRDDPDFHRDMNRLIEQLKVQTVRKRTMPVILILGLLIGIVVIGTAIPWVSQWDSGGTVTTISPATEETIQDGDVPTNTPSPSPTPLGGGSGQISFHSNRDGNFEVYVMNANGTNLANLTNNNAFDGISSWSPDGSRIAFVSDRDGNYEIYVMNADGSNLTRLTENGAYDSSPMWSPDGSRIAFVSDRDGNYEIYVMNADGSSNLTNNDSFDQNPNWSPDGSRISFESNRDGNGEIYVMNADGSNPVNLSHNSTFDGDSVWSPDGSYIAFTSNRDSNGEIYVMNADGSNPVNLSHNSAEDTFPAWSPEGWQIAFESDRDGNGEIYVMNADGSNPVNLSHNSANDYAPAWRP